MTKLSNHSIVIRCANNCKFSEIIQNSALKGMTSILPLEEEHDPVNITFSKKALFWSLQL